PGAYATPPSAVPSRPPTSSTAFPLARHRPTRPDGATKHASGATTVDTSAPSFAALASPGADTLTRSTTVPGAAGATARITAHTEPPTGSDGMVKTCTPPERLEAIGAVSRSVTPAGSVFV